MFGAERGGSPRTVGCLGRAFAERSGSLLTVGWLGWVVRCGCRCGQDQGGGDRAGEARRSTAPPGPPTAHLKCLAETQIDPTVYCTSTAILLHTGPTQSAETNGAYTWTQPLADPILVALPMMGAGRALRTGMASSAGRTGRTATGAMGSHEYWVFVTSICPRTKTGRRRIRGCLLVIVPELREAGVSEAETTTSRFRENPWGAARAAHIEGVVGASMIPVHKIK
eukprot:7500984-Pyramimonas_sp.AAC.2